FTIGIDEPTVIERKVKEAEEYPILKVKLGLENDEEIIKTIRKVTDKPIRVDANEGWKTKEVALEKIKWLQDEGVEFVEQPMPADDLDSVTWLRDKVDIPIIADENCIRLYDVPILGKAYDGINIKLMKCTGIREAIKMINTAKAMKMKVMLGCMIESSVGITAGAQISPLVDFADLDGNLLITNDPFEGVKVENGKLILPDEPGLGIKKLI
ncbi:MAG: enolase C-terminal domain-like protein, partial [Candidatus Kryptonium sp.]